jgi:hypothetical protein
MTSLMLSSDFGVSRNGQAIHELPAGGVVHTGIAFRVYVSGLVPWFEEMDAMIEAHHTPQSWDDLTPFQRADAVARYRLKRHISLHESEAAESAAKRKAAKGRKR